jgi:monovalent cation:H+ antiporter-2, CPA2 family
MSVSDVLGFPFRPRVNRPIRSLPPYTRGVSGGVFLRDVAVILAASFPVLFLCRKVRLPQVVGFMLTGVVIGPHALGWVTDMVRINGIASIGMVLILFFVGLQFPLERLLKLGKTALVGGPLQMLLTTTVVAGVSMATGTALRQALFEGILVSLSSSAVLIPILAARDELAAPFGRRFLGVSLFQDLAVIPLVLVLPAFAPDRPGLPHVGALALAGSVVLAIVAIALLMAAARTVVPRLLDVVSRMGSRESFTGAVIVLVLGLITFGDWTGVSAAMGAFAAGIVLGESEHVHEIASTLSPFRDLLSSLFFVSIGMLLAPPFVAAHPLLVAGSTLLVLVVKPLSALVALVAAGTVPRTALRAALALAPVGEFSFVLAAAGAGLGILDEPSQQTFVAVAVLTLTLAPLLVHVGPVLAPLLPERVEPSDLDDPHGKTLSRHVVVLGYGLSGRSVARVVAETHIPHCVVEIDPDRVAAGRRDGVRILRADATGRAGIEAAGIPAARAVVVTIQDPDGARRATRLCRQRNPNARLIVRTRYVSEVDALRQAGADEVIPEEFETSIEIVARLLRTLHIPGNVVATQLRLLRDEGYRRLRDPHAKKAGGRRVSALLAAGTTELFLVLPDTEAEGKLLSELHLDADHIAVPALLRDGEPKAPVPPDHRVEAGDTLLLVGAHEDLAIAIAKLERKTVDEA